MRILVILLLIAFTASNACAWPLTTFGYDYGYPRETENLEFIGQHHDTIIGSGEWQEKYMTEFQWDIIKAENPNATLIPYTVIQAFTFEEMETFFIDYTVANGGDTENLFLHYVEDQTVLMRTSGERTCGDGTEPSDRISDDQGVIMPECGDGDMDTTDCTSSLCRSNYYVSWGYDGDMDNTDGSSAQSRLQARTFQYWNAGFEPRMNHLSQEWRDAYPEYLVTVIAADQNVGTGKIADGVYLDTYTGIVDVDGYLPNMNDLESVIQEWGITDDTTARNNYSEFVTQYLNTIVTDMKTRFGLPRFHFVANYGDLGYVHGSGAQFAFAYEDFRQNVADGLHAAEYLTSPSKCTYFHTRDFFREHYEAYDLVQPGSYWVDQIDTTWSNFGDDYPTWENFEFMVGAFWLFKHPSARFQVHVGSGASYGPGIDPNIGEAKGGRFVDSHWHPLMEWEGGAPKVRAGEDFWGITGTDRMYVIEDFQGPGYPTPGRWVLGRDFDNGTVIVRLEESDNNPPYNENLGKTGEQPLTYTLPEPMCRVIGMNAGVPVYAQASDEVTLGLAEGAILGNSSQPGCGNDPTPTTSTFTFRGNTMTGSGLLVVTQAENPDASPMLNPDASPAVNPAGRIQVQ